MSEERSLAREKFQAVLGLLLAIYFLLSFFLSGLRLDLPGLSEIPLRTTPPSNTCRKEPFHSFILFHKKSFRFPFPFFSFLVGIFYIIQYDVRVYTSTLSSSIIRYLLSIPYRKRSTVQSTRTSSKASTRRSERDNASRQSWLEPACCRAFYTARCVLKTNEETKICPAYQNYSTIVTIHKEA